MRIPPTRCLLQLPQWSPPSKRRRSSRRRSKLEHRLFPARTSPTMTPPSAPSTGTAATSTSPSSPLTSAAPSPCHRGDLDTCGLGPGPPRLIFWAEKNSHKFSWMNLFWSGGNERASLLRGANWSEPAGDSFGPGDLPSCPQMWLVTYFHVYFCFTFLDGNFWRISWFLFRSISDSDLQLGEVKFSYGYGGTAKVLIWIWKLEGDFLHWASPKKIHLDVWKA